MKSEIEITTNAMLLAKVKKAAAERGMTVDEFIADAIAGTDTEE